MINSRGNTVGARGFISVIPGRREAASPESINTDANDMNYFVYLLASKKHGTIYLGVTNDLIRAFTNTKPKLSQDSRQSTESVASFGSKSMTMRRTRSCVKKK